MNIRAAAASCAAALMLAGCAAALNGETQPIYISTAPEVKANCVCSNDRGQWPVQTPGAVLVKRSGSVLAIRCEKPGWQNATAYLTPRLSQTAMIGSMMPYVGIVEAAVDGSTGAAMEYPSSYAVSLKPDATVTAAPSPAPAPLPSNTAAASPN
ncbi:MAG: hypothetical protein HY243_02045 [Proteobacteria bacterium]|nr:hypothetical protein [Pseudomonadota bacterium]